MVFWVYLKSSLHEKSLSTKSHAFYKLAIRHFKRGAFFYKDRRILQADLRKVFFASASVLFLDIGPQMEQLGNIFGSDYGKWVSRPSG